jgi:glucose-1-phosphate thymidylyltransferase
MTIKGLILSGGRGTRLRPITHTSAKQLVPVANRPILFHAIDAVRDAGILDIGIVVGDTHEEIRAAVKDGSDFGVRVTYLKQEEPLGLAHAVLVAEEFIAGDPFVMYLGDNCIRDGITPLVEEFRRESPNCQILLARVPDPSQFGVAALDDERRVTALEEKPKRATTPWSASTCSIITSSTRRVRSSPPGAASWRSPMRSRLSSIDGWMSAHTSSPGGGRIPASSRTCSRPTG